MPQLRGKSPVATTNALVALVVARLPDQEKHTMNAESAFIVATNAARSPTVEENDTHFEGLFTHQPFGVKPMPSVPFHRPAVATWRNTNL